MLIRTRARARYPALAVPIDGGTPAQVGTAAAATATCFFRRFYRSVPDEPLESARVDGAGPILMTTDERNDAVVTGIKQILNGLEGNSAPPCNTMTALAILAPLPPGARGGANPGTLPPAGPQAAAPRDQHLFDAESGRRL